MRVAFLGLGQMGGPMADHVVRAGHDVRVFDVDPDRCRPRVELGATAATSPADAARDAEVVAIVVFDDDQVLDACCGPNGVLEVLEPGSTITVHTTATLGTIRELAAAAAARGVAVVDAGISGGETGARDGTLLVMVGGTADDVERVRPVIGTFAKEVVHAGPLGTGMALKLTRNAVGYGWMAVAHDAMATAAAAGVEPAMLRHALDRTAVVDQALVPLGLGGPDPFAVGDPMRPYMEHVADLADKDLDHAQRLAGEVGVSVPLLDVTRANFRRAVRLDD